MIDTKFLDQLARFNLVIHKRVTSKYIGPRKAMATGRGMVFSDHRIYSPGDDYRAIDWRVFARTDNLYIKNYEEERNLTEHIIVDYSTSMNFGDKITKFDYASMLAVGFAYLALRENEKFMFSTFSDTLEIFQPKRGMSHLAAMVDHLNSLKIKGSSNLIDSLVHYKKTIGSRALVFLISDFLIDIEQIKEALFQLKGQQVKIIQVLDPLERNLNIQGDFILEDMESRSSLRTFISPRLRNQYQSKLDVHISQIKEYCAKLGFEFFSVTTDTSIFDVFYKVLN